MYFVRKVFIISGYTWGFTMSYLANIQGLFKVDYFLLTNKKMLITVVLLLLFHPENTLNLGIIYKVLYIV